MKPNCDLDVISYKPKPESLIKHDKVLADPLCQRSFVSGSGPEDWTFELLVQDLGFRVENLEFSLGGPLTWREQNSFSISFV